MGNFFSALGHGFTHGYTSVMGVISLVCATGSLAGVIPPSVGPILMGVCGVAQGLGLIFAADATKVAPKP